ncbi:MAG: FkbM family methyltransferase, partial [Minisyncoccia bacterium]
MFDIGANRGDAVIAGLNKGYNIIAIEAAPIVFKQLVKNFIYSSSVVPLKFAVSNKDNESVEFYECEEDGLSTLNKEWLTNDSMPYNGKSYRSIKVNTITIDTLAKIYGNPDLIKIDVEGAEDIVFAGMKKKYGLVTFECTIETIKNHEKQLNY